MTDTLQTSKSVNRNSILDRAEPQLGALEQAYRQHFLQSDKNQTKSILPVYMVAMLIFAAIDFQLFGVSKTLVLLYGARILYIGATVLLWFNLQRLENEKHIDQHVLNWSLATICLIFIVNITRSNSFFYNVPVDVLVIIGFYLMIPNNLLYRLIPAVLFTLGDIGLLLFFREGVSLAGIRSNMITMILSNIVGFIVSTRLYAYRRTQFQLQEESRLARLEIERIALTDALTTIPNRRRFLEALGQEYQRFRRTQRPFCVLYCDLDYFKKINDHYGHAAGDQVLVEFGKLLSSQIRQVDLAGRLGGEEFAVLLVETEHQAALEVAERIRTQFQNLSMSHNGSEFKITVSIGLTQARATDDSFEAILHRADQALYLAKNAGRNNTQCFSEV
jgi:diguanylate cyclase (GGDEF)-like protein